MKKSPLFKYCYWLGDTDTVSMTVFENTELTNSKKKKFEYEKYGAFEATINKISNSSYYWEIRSDIDKAARQENRIWK